MTSLQDMPVVTVEQITRFREAALKIESQRDEMLQAFRQIANHAFDCGATYQTAQDAAFGMQQIAEEQLSKEASND